MRRFALALLLASLAWSAVFGAEGVPDLPTLELPAKPSEMLEAPLATWAPVLNKLAHGLQAREAALDRLTRTEQRELRIQQALVAQSRSEWVLVRQAVAQVRLLQDSESGKHLAGLLNELLSDQQLRGGDAEWLRQAVHDRVMSMPWGEVGPAVRALHQQLRDMQAEAIRDYVARRMDLSSGFAQQKVTGGFALQLLGARAQLLQVLPQRGALVMGLDDVLRERSPLGPEPHGESGQKSAQ